MSGQILTTMVELSFYIPTLIILTMPESSTIEGLGPRL
jgi:hypothetical protein